MQVKPIILYSNDEAIDLKEKIRQLFLMKNYVSLWDIYGVTGHEHLRETVDNEFGFDDWEDIHWMWLYHRADMPWWQICFKFSPRPLNIWRRQ